MENVTQTQESSEATEEKTPYYKIDSSLLQERGRSVELILLHRRCPRCWQELNQRDDSLQKVTVKEHFKKFAQCCSKYPNFISPGIPILEAVFRLLLSSKNNTIGLDRLQETLMQRWADPVNQREISLQALRRMIEADTYYSISRVESP